MISQILHQLENITELLQYFTGSVTTTTATKKYAATNIGVGVAVGDKVVFAGFSNADSNGVKTLATVAANEVTVDETIGTGESGVTATMNQEAQGNWQNVERWAKLTGTVNTSGNATLYIDQSADAGDNTDYSSSFTITGGTALAFSVETVAKHAKMRIRNNGADQTTMRAYMYGRHLT